jgi:glycerophosphoryl diester phosphodiesterase
MKKILLFLLLSLLFSCEKETEIFEVENLSRDYITVLGHGGMGISSVYPINTFESIMNCLNLGTDGSEIDVQMTKDSVLVAFHDSDLSEKTNLTGSVSQYTFAELQAGNYDEMPYKSYAIISLDQLFSNIDDLSSHKFTFDCKLYNADKNDDAYLGRFANAIEAIALKYQIQRKLLIESNDKNFLMLLGAKDYNFKLFIYPQTFEEGLETAKELNLFGITIANEDITAEQVVQSHDAGFRIAVWNVQTEDENIVAIRKNPDFIQTDKVKHLVEAMAATDEVYYTMLKQRIKADSLLGK